MKKAWILGAMGVIIIVVTSIIAVKYNKIELIYKEEIKNRNNKSQQKIEKTPEVTIKPTEEPEKNTLEEIEAEIMKNVKEEDIMYKKEINENTKIRIVYSGSVLGQRELIMIHKTTDGGKSWKSQIKGEDLTMTVNDRAKFEFLDENVGFINNLNLIKMNAPSESEGLLVTQNGGESFEYAKFEKPNDTIDDTFYVNEVPYIEEGKLKVKIYPLDYSRIEPEKYYEYYSTDNGMNWKYSK